MDKIDKHEFATLGRMVAGRAGVAIAKAKTGGWYSDPYKRIIYYPDQPEYEDSDIGGLIHESGHIRFSVIGHGGGGIDQKLIKKLEDEGYPGQAIFQLINGLEDIRIEDKMCGVYLGSRRYLKNFHLKTWDSNKKRFDELKPAEQKMAKGNKAFNYILYMLWKENLRKHDEYLDYYSNREPILMEAIKATEDVIESNIKNLKTTDEVVEFIEKHILEWYLKLLDKTPKEVMELMKKFKEAMKGILEEMEKEAEKRGTPTKGDPEGSPIPMEERTKDDKIQIGDPGDDEVKIERIKEDDEILGKIMAAITAYGAQVRKALSILKDNKITRFLGGFESGRLNGTKLFKVPAGGTRVFDRKLRETKDKEIAFMLLVDESGSMNGEKAEQAAISAGLLSHAMEKANIPFAVAGFNSFFNVHKEFDKKLDIKELKKVRDYAQSSISGKSNPSWNCDGWAIQEASKMLSKRAENKKVLIVLSDGLPAPCNKHDSGDYDLKNNAKKAEEKFDVFSIGIMDSSVKSYYKDNCVINSPAELAPIVVKQFRKYIKKRV